MAGRPVLTITAFVDVSAGTWHCPQCGFTEAGHSTDYPACPWCIDSEGFPEDMAFEYAEDDGDDW